MRYPSEFLRALSERVDELEQRILDKDLDFWNWPRLRSDLLTAERQRDELLNHYARLVVNVEEKHGKRTVTDLSMVSWSPFMTEPYRLLLPLVKAAVDGERNRRKKAA